MLVALKDRNIFPTTWADIKLLVQNILKSDFIMLYTITNEPIWKAPTNRSNAGRFQRTKTFKAVDL